MKKIYLMAIVFCAVSTSAFAQFTDDFESYSQGPLFNDIWRTWDDNNDGAQNIIVTAEQQLSGAFSGKIGIGGATGGPQDAILSFEGASSANSGIWTVQWMMFIPTGNSGYFNLQGSIDPSANDNLEFVSGNITFNAAGATPGFGADDNVAAPAAFQFPHDEWFTVNVVVDTDNNTYQLNVADSSIAAVAWGASATSGDLGGVDFFAADPQNTYYVDDVVFAEGILNTNDFASEAFSVYPNPVKDVLNISSKVSVDTVVVYDVLGKVVLTSNPGSVSPSINMAGLTSGAYLVKISGNGSTQTIKVLK